MVSAQRALKIINEPDPAERDKMIDRLGDEEAKYLLKGVLHTLKQDAKPSWSMDK